MKPTLKKVSLDKLLVLVRQHIIDRRDAGNYLLFKEALADRFRVKVGLIEQCLHTLNLEGLVSQAQHRKHHDPGYWARDVYYVNEKRDVE